ncbi:unnamed protein product [Gordionus sp. m RMFG-2023]|uniref:replication factor C subunit 5-like n=1 Tax=Gordionus sp. m RMFG-2023 TaxID=3053472 RepID=UPI0030E45428
MDNLPWIEKYRPKNFDEVIAHKDIIETIHKFIKENKLPHLLFYGTPGTGKTSTILACAKLLYTPKEYSSMVLELNASDDRGIEIVRGPILNFASTKTVFNQKFKLIILDEADAMTKDSQNALRRIIEKYTSNVRFCLIGNHLSGIIPAIISRCTRYRFGPLNSEAMLNRVTYIAQEEKLNVTDDGIKALVKLANGDMRKALNVMQSTSMAYDIIDQNNVYTTTGQPLPQDIKDILEWMLNLPLKSAYENILDLKVEKGLSLQDILTEIHLLVHLISLPVTILQSLTEKLANLEYQLSFGTNERIQLSALVGVFQSAKDPIVALSCGSS